MNVLATFLYEVSTLAWPTVAAFLLLSLAIRTLTIAWPFFLWTVRSRYANEHRVFRIPVREQQLNNEIGAFIPVFIADAIVMTVMFKKHMMVTDESHVLGTFLMAFIWSEIWFYASHRLMHNRHFYFLHRQHHESKVTTPLTGMSFSFAERLLLAGGVLGGLGVLSMFYSLSLTGICAELVVNYVLALSQHSNVEYFSPQMRKLFFFLLTPTHHSLHHARSSGNYGLYTPFMDRWFKSEFPDVEEATNLAFTGRGLLALGERLDRKSSGLLNDVVSGRREIHERVNQKEFQSPYIYEVPKIREWLNRRLETMQFDGPQSLTQDGEQYWHVLRKNQILGPLALHELAQLKVDGAINTADLCFSIKRGMKLAFTDIPLAPDAASRTNPLFLNRHAPRMSFQSVVNVHSAEGDSTGITLDVSVDSAAIYTKTWLSVGETVDLQFQSIESEISTKAVVVNVQPHKEGWRFGVRFLKFDRRAAARWTSYINGEAA